ncbi:MAG: neutral/alkaline non-lysosomal ceramidase N-terminal domain-containing protein [Bacteroidales bacterium]|nr:neutral/alkaline non-lysosomal ceramidase N-terminal domain-containing protein [Bacteroidales bacterium]
MKKATLFSVFSSVLILLVITSTTYGNQQSNNKGWKAGVARVVITPQEPIWMAGYGGRDHPSEGMLVDLWAKALALEDAKGKKVILVTADLLGFPKNMSDHIRDQIAVKYGLTRSQIILSSSHTHTGPVLMDALFDIYPLDAAQLGVIKKYSDNLEKKIIALTGEALHSMVPAQLFSMNGVARFQVNRRNNNETTLNKQTDLNGPNDYAVPVLKVADSSGNLMAVAFGYACHATVLNFYQFSGDYPGFAQIEMEKLHPGVTAMFFQGAGADQNPLPRRSVPIAQQYGRELAAAVDRVLNEDMKKLEPSISTAYSEINLTFSTPPTKEELIKIEKEANGYEKRWASNQLAYLKRNGSLRTSYPYPVQIWKLGDQPLMTLGGELVIQYSIELKKLFGTDIFVMGYANDVMTYIPSETVLKEGGYEGESSKMVYGMPSKWNSDIQVKILNEFKKLAAKAGVKQVVQ